MALPNNPQTRKEMYLSNMAGQGTALPSEPHTREEEYLDFIAKNGGGGGGTGDGDMKKSVYDNDNAVLTAGGIKPFVNTAISGKVDKVQGKGLSSNDYDDSAKAIVDNVTTALEGKVSKSNTAGLVKNDGTIDTTTTGAVAANTSAISAIKDGTNIDSFGDVETALAGKMPNYGIGIGLYVDSYTNQLRADAVTKAIKDSPKLITSGAVFSGLSPKYSTAEQEETDLDGQDKFPFYDNSASAKRHTTFGNIKAKLKEYFDSLYVAAVAGKGLSTNDYDDTEKAKVAGAFPRSEQAVLGAKNFLPLTLASLKTTTSGGSWADNVYTNGSIAYTIITNSAGYVTEILANGTSDENDSYIRLTTSLDSYLTDGVNYTLNGCPSGGGQLKYMIYTGSAGVWDDTGTGTSKVYVNTIKNLFIKIKSGTTVTNMPFKPMIRLGSDPDPTFAPYAMTNKELTDVVQGITVKIFTTESITVNAGQYSPQEISIANGDLIPLGIVGYRIDGNGNTECGMWKNWMDISTKKVLLGVKNYSASATATITVTIFVLYKG